MSTTGPARVIAGYDGSPDAKRALAWAADLACMEKTALHVVVAMGDLQTRRVTDLDDRWERNRQAELSTDAREAVDALEFDDVSLEISQYPPAPALLQPADASTVIVLGSRGRGRLSEALLGSVSQHIAQHAPCTVVVVREPSDPAGPAVVVGVDGSPGCVPALDFAFEYAAQRELPVRAVHVAEHTMTPEDAELSRAEPVVVEALRPYAEKYPDVPVERQLLAGSVVRGLADASEHAGLVVVGSRGRGAFESLLGSVGQGLLHHARCPVAIAR